MTCTMIRMLEKSEHEIAQAWVSRIVWYRADRNLWIALLPEARHDTSPWLHREPGHQPVRSKAQPRPASHEDLKYCSSILKQTTWTFSISPQSAGSVTV